VKLQAYSDSSTVKNKIGWTPRETASIFRFEYSQKQNWVNPYLNVI